MVVKCKRGRTRYVAFDVSSDLKKDVLIRHMKSNEPDNPLYVVQCTNGKAIIRCAPKTRERTIRVMSQADPSCVSLMTSGTLRKIRERYPELKAPKK